MRPLSRIYIFNNLICCIFYLFIIILNATQMINGLIADNEASVTDIIRQVLRGNTSVASSVSSESGSRLGSVCESKTTALTTPATPKGANQAAQSTPQTTNVWQQRMAARELLVVYFFMIMLTFFFIGKIYIYIYIYIYMYRSLFF
uniref:Uncharacterized protein n=1 Tax=Heterorhabditis bacteriophora TaxID=37862 RepID=A0A1I7WM21_HETBA